jgi:hypothetical protein
MKQTLRLAVRPSVVKRALKFAFVVGLVLIAINHGDALVKGDVTRGRLWRMALTVVVPYVVSTLSSVGAMQDRGASRSDEPQWQAPVPAPTIRPK